MRSDTHSSGDARPVLGETVPAILAAWHHAARLHTNGATRVRALAFLRDATREFCWVGEAIHQITDTGESHPATTVDLDVLTGAIAYGWFLVYLQEDVGQQARVLHQLGVHVPLQALGPQDLPRLLQEHTVPLPDEPGQAEVAERPGTPASSPPGSLQGQHLTGLPAINPSLRRRPEATLRFLVRIGIAGEALLLLGGVLVATRNPWYCLGTLALLVVLILTLRFSRRARPAASSEQAGKQTPSANR
jgi:hypothetical protein